MERHGRAKQMVVFFGAASIGTEGGWGADAVLWACCKLVCRPRGSDQRRGRVVLMDEHRTTRVSSAVNGQQPCEEELDQACRLEAPRRAVAPRKPPQAPCSSQEATQAAASEPGPSTPLPAKRTKAEPTQPTKAAKAKTSTTARQVAGQGLQCSAEHAVLWGEQARPPAQLHPDAHEEGGLACNNEELLKQQRESVQAILGWVGSMGKKLFTGNFNLINTPFPVVMFEPRSYLEKLADVWVYPHFLLQASQTKDPVHRMKLVMTWFVAGLHHGFEKWKKPFNPILGETWQAELADGSSMFLEQISHHPPITAFNLEGPAAHRPYLTCSSDRTGQQQPSSLASVWHEAARSDFALAAGGAYKFNGLSQPNVSLLLKHSGIRTVAKGYRYIVFADGCRIDLHYPGYSIKGVVYASRPRAEVEGSAVFVDAKNQLHGVLRFGGRKSARLPVMRRSDAVHGGIYDMRGLQQQASSPINPPTLAAEDSCSSEGAEGGWPPGATPGPPSGPNHLAPIQGDGESEGEEGFESASESEWEAGELSNVQPNGVEPSPPPPAAGGPLGGSGSEAAGRGGAARQSVELRNPQPQGVSSGGAEPSGSREVGGGRSSNPGLQPPGLLLQSLGTGGSGPSPRGVPTPYSGAGQAQGLLSGLSKMMGFTASSGGGSGGSSSALGHGGAGGGAGGGGEGGTMQGELPLGQLLLGVEGSWLSHLDVGGERCWTLANEKPGTWQAVADALPSDSRYRQDLKLVKAGDIKEAQAWKEALENVQRRDKKLREAAGAASASH
ncbi:hypothetical protein QJQ45_008429 [Haematococcus lacustris]|nr:hypothetical protein QJQ45_008429 [Haematococcus lacustris]